MKEKQKIMNKIKSKELNQAMLDSAARELQACRLQLKSLENALDEISAITDDPLAKGVAIASLYRYELDQRIHARLLFKENKGLDHDKTI